MKQLSAYIDSAIARPAWVALSALFLAALPVVLFWKILPVISLHVVQRLPVALEKQLGEFVLREQAAFPYQAPHRLSIDKQNFYRDRVQQLAKLAQIETVRVEFVGGLPNAYALPGNIMVLSSGLIDLMEKTDNLLASEWIDAVIAHELGHLRERHVLQSVLSIELLRNIVLKTNGASGTAGQTGGVFSGLFLSPHYSRQRETQADEYAHQLLIKNAMSPIRLAEALCHLEGQRVVNRFAKSGYTSSHPASSARMESARHAAIKYANLSEQGAASATIGFTCTQAKTAP